MHRVFICLHVFHLYGTLGLQEQLRTSAQAVPSVSASQWHVTDQFWWMMHVSDPWCAVQLLNKQ